MDLVMRMRIYNAKQSYGNFFEMRKAGICYTIIENLLLYCPKFSAFVVAVII